LEVASEIYGRLQTHYRQMVDVSASWARAAIEAMLALDVLQVRLTLPDGREAHKAVLLPTHSLHLVTPAMAGGSIRLKSVGDENCPFNI
jgi:hypothetical protein